MPIPPIIGRMVFTKLEALAIAPYCALLILSFFTNVDLSGDSVASAYEDPVAKKRIIANVARRYRSGMIFGAVSTTGSL